MDTPIEKRVTSIAKEAQAALAKDKLGDTASLPPKAPFRTEASKPPRAPFRTKASSPPRGKLRTKASRPPRNV